MNIKISKKLLSMITAGILMVSPILSSAEEIVSENNNGFTLVKQEMKVEGNDLDIDRYANELEGLYKYVSQKMNYDELKAQLQTFYTIVNRPYMSSKSYDELIENGAIFSDEYIRENFNNAFDFIYSVNKYNSEKIREDYQNGTMDINHLIDPSLFCYDSHDRKIVRSVFENYFNAYKNGLFENDSFIEAFKQITTLNSKEQGINAFHAETGATWNLQMLIGRPGMIMLEDDMSTDYTIDELSLYYEREGLEAIPRKWILRKDILLDLNCLSPLEYEIFIHQQLEKFCYKFVNNNVYKLFNVTRNLETANPLESYEYEGEKEEISTETIEETTGFSLDLAVEGVDLTSDYTYTECVKKAYEYLLGKKSSTQSKKIDYEHLQQHLQCFVYLSNREHLTDDEESYLISNGIVFKTDFNDPEGMQNFMEAYELIANICEYNQSVIQDDYENGTMDINHLIDPSIFCMNANDRKLVHEIHVAYFKAYQSGRFKNDYFLYCVSKLAEEKGVTPLSDGAMWNVRNTDGRCLRQAIRDDAQADFKPKEIVTVYDNVELAGAQWVVKEGVNPNIDSDNELEAGAAYYKLLDLIVNVNVNNDLFESFNIPCANVK